MIMNRRGRRLRYGHARRGNLAGLRSGAFSVAVEAQVAPAPGNAPPGWVGIVSLGGLTMITVPNVETANTVRTRLRR